MPLAILRDALDAPPSRMKRRHWTRTDYFTLLGAGAFDGQRHELIRGELIDKTGENPPHPALVTLLAGRLAELFGVYRVRVQGTIDVTPEDNPTSLPEPDICVTTTAAEHFVDRHPAAPDIVLLAEVSDSTLGFDTSTKADLYARAGIADYWVLDVRTRRIIVHRDPADGYYRSLTVYRANEPVSPLAAPSASLTLSR